MINGVAFKSVLCFSISPVASTFITALTGGFESPFPVHQCQEYNGYGLFPLFNQRPAFLTRLVRLVARVSGKSRLPFHPGKQMWTQMWTVLGLALAARAQNSSGIIEDLLNLLSWNSSGFAPLRTPNNSDHKFHKMGLQSSAQSPCRLPMGVSSSRPMKPMGWDLSLEPRPTSAATTASASSFPLPSSHSHLP